MKKRIKILAVPVAVAALILLLWSVSGVVRQRRSQSYKGKLAVHVLDVGQGDAIFVSFPDGQTMLVDAGVSGCGSGIVSYIREAGFPRLDYVVATHPHSDHIGSMAYMIRHMDVGAFCMPAVTNTTDAFENMLLAVQEKEPRVIKGGAGTRLISADSYSVDVIAPSVTEDDLNNCSVVLKITYGNNSFLLAGDAGLEEMGTVSADLHADMLKVAHHGSADATDAALLEKIHPQIAVISCGKDNDYGHPHREVLRDLTQAGCRTYRTDIDHTVIVVSDGNALTVKTGRSVWRDD